MVREISRFTAGEVGMEQRVVEFIRGLRAAGVRVSLAESVDALHAVEALGVIDKDVFRSSLRTTLIKESDDFAAFEELFPLTLVAAAHHCRTP